MTYKERVCNAPVPGDVRIVRVYELGSYVLEVVRVTDTEVRAKFCDVKGKQIAGRGMKVSRDTWKRSLDKFSVYLNREE